MGDIAIRVEGLGKRYRIGERAPYRTIREAVTGAFTAPFRWFGRKNGQAKPDDHIWALKDVSFEVKQGEVVGIIGRNGAGKSTLLKILSRITEPTEGRAEIHGRVRALLEVGTGFHPELTGRENIFLNGAVLGMKRAEISRKFDEIVAFAEIGKFLDTPVKWYSSGMYVRLAFAVAAHLEPEILLVDEVLAVGDAAFQKKCLGMMGEVARGGRTILFVSHNMIAVQSLCTRALWLESGSITGNGTAGEVVASYLRTSLKGGDVLEEAWDDVSTAPGSETVRLRRVRVCPQGGESPTLLTMRTPFQVEIEYWNLMPEADVHITLNFYTEQEVIAFTTGSASDSVWNDRPKSKGLYRSVCFVPGDLLNSGRHRFAVLVIKDKANVHQHHSKVSFDILDLNARQFSWMGKEPGVVQPVLRWTTECVETQRDEAASTGVGHA